MTLYDEYRRQYPINPEPSEFRDIIESEIKRVIAWMEAPPWPASVADWTEADYERAKELMAPLVDMIAEYESLHYPIAEPTEKEAEEFRIEQERPLSAEDIKPGRRYWLHNDCPLLVTVELNYGSRPLVFTEDEYYVGSLEDLLRKGATFQAVEEG